MEETEEQEAERREAEASQRLSCTLGPATVRHLKLMAERGFYGGTVPKVMASLIEEGIRNATKDGLLKVD